MLPPDLRSNIIVSRPSLLLPKAASMSCGGAFRKTPIKNEYSLDADGRKISRDSDDSELDFVEDPSQDYFCPVSLEILHSPQLTDCCGHHLSIHVAERLLKDKKPCPMCKEAKLVTHNDRFFERKVNDLKVRCHFKSKGCEWIGELRDLEGHSKTCPKRPWTCMDCGEEVPVEIAKAKHLRSCPKQKIPCPNRCGIDSILAFNKEKHLEVCPLQMVSCLFVESGCNTKMPRKDLHGHLEEKAQQHTMAMMLLSFETIKSLRQRFDEVDKRSREKEETLAAKERELAEKDHLLEQKDGEITRLKSELTAVKEELEKQATNMKQELIMKEMHQELQAVLKFNYSATFEFTLQRYSQCKMKDSDGNWCGPSFYYPCEKGYNLELSIDTNGYERGTGTHLSAYINPNKGRHDDMLQWPVVCKVYLLLLNQQGDFGHHGGSAIMEWDKGNVNYRTISFTFFPLENLEYDATRNTQYLRDDCLHFRLYLDMRPKMKT